MIKKGDIVQLKDSDTIFHLGCERIGNATSRAKGQMILDQLTNTLQAELPTQLQIHSIKHRSHACFCSAPGAIRGKQTAEQIAKLLFLVPTFALLGE